MMDLSRVMLVYQRVGSLVGGLEHEWIMTFHSVGNSSPNWRTHVFQRGSNHQPGVYFVTFARILPFSWHGWWCYGFKSQFSSLVSGVNDVLSIFVHYNLAQKRFLPVFFAIENLIIFFSAGFSISVVVCWPQFTNLLWGMGWTLSATFGTHGRKISWFCAGSKLVYPLKNSRVCYGMAHSSSMIYQLNSLFYIYI
jgi:hypothetical protein